MRTEVHAGSTMNAFDGLLLLVQGYRAHQAGLLAAAAADAAIFVKDHTAVWPLLHSARGACFGTGRVLTGPADDHTEIAFNSALRLHLDGAVLQGDGAGTNPAASEHAAVAADAALRMGHLESAASSGLCWGGSFCLFMLKRGLGLCIFPLFCSLALRHFLSAPR